MKVTIEPTAKVFQPVEATFTLETQAELDAMGSLFNAGSVIYALNKIAQNASTFSTTYRAFEQLGADISQTHRFKAKE